MSQKQLILFCTIILKLWEKICYNMEFAADEFQKNYLT